MRCVIGRSVVFCLSLQKAVESEDLASLKALISLGVLKT